MLNKKSLLKIDGLSSDDVIKIMETADSFTDISKREIKKVPTLRGKTVVNLFFEPSTRTRTSFELAAKRLSADMINFTASASSLKKGESIMDTLRTILAMQVDLIVIRHSDSGTVKMVDDITPVPVINAGDGKHQHPTQALLDLYAIRSRFKEFKGLKVAITGDFLNSRVAGSDIALFEKMGMEVSLVAPPMLLPEDHSDFNVYSSIDDVIESTDVLYMLRMQFERQDRKFYPSVREYNRFLSLNSHRIEKMKKHAIVMHPGPVNRGIEISDEVMGDRESPYGSVLIEDQVTGGVAVRMALLYLILG
jgi:aspartate carbamoyltransferase catalytic subunit